jgi:hypothetical protein
MFIIILAKLGQGVKLPYFEPGFFTAAGLNPVLDIEYFHWRKLVKR